MRQAAKWKGFVGLGVAVAAVSLASPVMSADHRDAPATSADAASDINDVYTWMDGTNVVLAMTVSPLADSTAKFSDKTQYVFHTASGSAFGTTSSNVDVICTFDTSSPQKAQCWVGADDYVPPGDASATAGISSASGKVKVFAGMRADPFFFNLCGFRDAVGLVDSVEGTLTFDGSGCPAVGAAATAIQDKLKETGPVASDPGAATDPVTTYCKSATRTGPDDFAGFNTLAIVVSVDKSLVTKGGAVMSVWGATYKAP